MFFQRNILTDYCLHGCFNKYDDVYYCNANGRNYCCKNNVKSTKTQCFSDVKANITCSRDVRVDELKYTYCPT